MSTPVEAQAPRKLRAAGPVRVTLPARVAYDPKALKETIATLVERLGCPSCFSGAACSFEMERDFVINPATAGSKATAFAVDAAPRRLELGAQAAATQQINVGLASSVKYDLKKVYEAVDRVIDLIGPHPCISGFDTLFRDELVIVNEQLQAKYL